MYACKNITFEFFISVMLRIQAEMVLQLPNAFCDCWELAAVLYSQDKLQDQLKMIVSLKHVFPLFADRLKTVGEISAGVFRQQAYNLCKIIGECCMYNFEKRLTEINQLNSME